MHQQELDFEAEGKFHEDVRERFCTDMEKTIKQLHSENSYVILMGDMNENLNRRGNRIETLLTKCGMKNAAMERFGDHIELPRTYQRGKNCLDLIAVSDTKENIIRKVGFLPFHSEFCTDHRVEYIDLDLDKLVGNPIPDTNNPSLRTFTTSKVKRCEKYKTELNKMCKQSKIMETIKEIVQREKENDISPVEIENRCQATSVSVWS